MTDIGPGTRVICVDGDFTGDPDDIHFPVEGRAYTIRGINPSDEYSAAAYWLEEITNPINGRFEPSFFTRRFRPIHNDDIQIFRDIEANPDKPIEADQFDMPEVVDV